MTGRPSGGGLRARLALGDEIASETDSWRAVLVCALVPLAFGGIVSVIVLLAEVLAGP